MTTLTLVPDSIDCVTCGVEIYSGPIDGECMACVREANERAAEARSNPIDMSNRRAYIFDGSDMRYYKFRLSDLENGFTRGAAKAQGLTLTVNGRKRTYTDKDGVIQFVYSYDACIYARMFDIAENMWRDVFNVTPYSSTTAKHQNETIYAVLGIGRWQWLSGNELTLQARRAVEMVRCSAHMDHGQMVRFAHTFVNRGEGAIAAYLEDRA